MASAPASSSAPCPMIPTYGSQEGKERAWTFGPLMAATLMTAALFGAINQQFSLYTARFLRTDPRKRIIFVTGIFVACAVHLVLLCTIMWTAGLRMGPVRHEIFRNRLLVNGMIAMLVIGGLISLATHGWLSRRSYLLTRHYLILLAVVVFSLSEFGSLVWVVKSTLSATSLRETYTDLQSKVAVGLFYASGMATDVLNVGCLVYTLRASSPFDGTRYICRKISNDACIVGAGLVGLRLTGLTLFILKIGTTSILCLLVLPSIYALYAIGSLNRRLTFQTVNKLDQSARFIGRQSMTPFVEVKRPAKTLLSTSRQYLTRSHDDYSSVSESTGFLKGDHWSQQSYRSYTTRLHDDSPTLSQTIGSLEQDGWSPTQRFMYSTWTYSSTPSSLGLMQAP